MSANDPLRQALERLSANWREQAERLRRLAAKIRKRGDLSIIGGATQEENDVHAASLSDCALQLSDCADELDDALAGERRAPEEPTDATLPARGREQDEPTCSRCGHGRRFHPTGSEMHDGSCDHRFCICDGFSEGTC